MTSERSQIRDLSEDVHLASVDISASRWYTVNALKFHEVKGQLPDSLPYQLIQHRFTRTTWPPFNSIRESSSTRFSSFVLRYISWPRG